MWRLWFKFLGLRVVAIEHYSGQFTIRFARMHKGGMICRDWDDHYIVLNLDGSIEGFRAKKWVRL